MRNDTLKSTIDDLIGTLRPAAAASEQLAAAKEDATSLAADSIRAFAKRASAINVALTDDEVETIAEEVAKGAYSGASVKVRKSEIGTLLRQRKHLPAIITGIDQIATALKAHDAKAPPLNIRQQVISAARALRKDDGATVAEVMTALRGKVLKKPPSPIEKARALVERLRAEAAWRVKVGDETMLDQDADAALTILDNLLDGKRPTAEADTVPLADYQDLQQRVAELEDQLKEATHPVHTTILSPLEQGPMERITLPEAPQSPQDGDEEKVGSSTSEPDIAVPGPSAAIPEGTKRRSTGSSLTGYDIDELLDMSKKK